MASPCSKAAPVALPALAAIALPLLGAWWWRPELAAKAFQFPPQLEVPYAYTRWSWWWCFGVLSPFAMLALAWWRRRRQPPPAQVTALKPRSDRFPWWGAPAVFWTALWWWLAWNRFDWFAGGQRYTFFPLWLGFVITVNAMTHRRGGNTLLYRAPAAWAALFGASALFWWGFEWLNRFVRNWHYVGVEDFGPLAYALHASLCFSTVLPAVLAVRELLVTCPRLQRELESSPRLVVLGQRTTGTVLIALSLAALLLTGAHPQQLYPALWLAPLLLSVGIAIATGRNGWWRELAIGDWRTAGSWALAALFCGGFWELWNYHSAAKWIYTVPYVDRLHVFEMPLLGYLGYLAFGLECSLVAEAVVPSHLTRPGGSERDGTQLHQPGRCTSSVPDRRAHASDRSLQLRGCPAPAGQC